MDSEGKNKKLEDMMHDLSEIGMDLDLRKEWESELRKDAPRSNQVFIRRALAIAAVFVLLVAVPFLLRSGQGDITKMGLTNILEAEKTILEDMALRGGENNAEYLILAREAMEENKAAEALSFYDQVEENLGYPDQLIRSIAYFKTGNIEASEKILNQIIDEDNIYSSDANWILGNINLKQKNYEKSLEILSRIKDKEEYTGIEQLKLNLKEQL